MELKRSMAVFVTASVLLISCGENKKHLKQSKGLPNLKSW